jgi:hypothetical protein
VITEVSRFRLTSPKTRLSENDVERACVDLLRYRGWYVARQQSGLFKTPDGRWIRIGEPGVPDYNVMKAPSFLLEVKRPGGELSPEQKEQIRKIELGFRLPIVVVESVEELITWLDRHERSP